MNHALATDFNGTPVTLTHYRVEPGVNDRDGQFVIMKVTRGVRQSGDIAWVERIPLSWWPDEAAAYGEKRRLEVA